MFRIALLVHVYKRGHPDRSFEYVTQCYHTLVLFEDTGLSAHAFVSALIDKLSGRDAPKSMGEKIGTEFEKIKRLAGITIGPDSDHHQYRVVSINVLP